MTREPALPPHGRVIFPPPDAPRAPWPIRLAVAMVFAAVPLAGAVWLTLAATMAQWTIVGYICLVLIVLTVALVVFDE